MPAETGLSNGAKVVLLQTIRTLSESRTDLRRELYRSVNVTDLEVILVRARKIRG